MTGGDVTVGVGARAGGGTVLAGALGARKMGDDVGVCALPMRRREGWARMGEIG